jgi:signal transduction histidine kinase
MAYPLLVDQATARWRGVWASRVWRFWPVPLVALAAALAIGAVALKLSHDARMDAQERGHQSVQQAVSSAEGHINRVLVGLDGLLLGQSQWLAMSTQSDGQVAMAQLRQMMRLNAQNSLVARDLMLLRADGSVAARVSRGDGLAQLPEGFVRQVLAHGQGTLQFSAIVSSPMTAERMVYAGRQVRAPDGSALAAVAQVSVGLLGVSLGHHADWAGAAVGLGMADGQWLASLPDGSLSLAGLAAGAWQVLPRNGQAQWLDGVQATDGAAQWVAVRPTLYPQLSVVAVVPQASVFAQVKVYQRQVWAFAGLALALLALLTVVVWRYLLAQAALRDELRSTRQVLVNALDSMTEGFMVLDRRLRVVSVNERFGIMFPWLRELAVPGADLATLMQASAAQVRPEASNQERSEWAQERIEQVKLAGTAAVQVYPDGRSVLSQHRMTPEGHVVVQFREITQQLADERELQQARDQAEAANRAKSNFLAVMSHEIRTPMNGVLGMAEVLAQSKLQPDQAEALQAIRVSSDVLLRLLDDILDFSKLEAGLLELDEQPLQLSDLVASACAALLPVARKRVVDLSWSVQQPMPPWVLGDGMRLRQVLTNLVGNAIKFSAGRADVQGKVQVHASWQAAASGESADTALLAPAPNMAAGQWVLRVQDNGIGLSEAAQAKLFADYVQAEASTTHRYGGTGLGLAICRRIVERMGGDITVRSQLGQGATFEVRVPLHPVAAPLQDPLEPVAIAPRLAKPNPQAPDFDRK